MTPTLRRLNDRERYYGLTWPGWLAVALAAGVLYGAVRLSPLGVKTTVTIALVALAFLGTVLAGVSGQALSPARHLLAITRYHCAVKRYTPPASPDKRGLVLDHAPDLSDGDPAEGWDGEELWGEAALP